MSYKKAGHTKKVNTIRWDVQAKPDTGGFCIWQVIRLELAVFLLLLSSKLCLESVFTEVKLNLAYLYLGCLISLGIFVGVGVENMYASNKRYRMSLIYVLIYGALFGLYFADRKKYILGGLQNFYHIYLKQFNFYYKTNYEDFGAGNASQLGISMGFCLFVLLIVLLIFCYASGCFRCMGIFPLIVVVSQMVIGWSPSFPGLAVGLGGFLMLPSGRQKPRMKLEALQADSRGKRSMAMITTMLVCALLALTVPGICAKLFTAPAQKLNGKAGELQQTQTAAEEKLSGILQWVFPGDGLDVNNRKPIYRKKEVFTVTLDTHGDRLDDSGESMSTCSQNVYLRSDYGDFYQNGSWKSKDEIFSEACEQAGWEEEKVAADLAGQTERAMTEKFSPTIYVPIGELDDRERTMNRQPWSYTIDYTGRKLKRNLLPYGICAKDAGLDFVGQYELAKPGKKQQIFDAWAVEFGQMNTFYAQYVSLFFDIEHDGEIEQWYDSYVMEHDLIYPKWSVPSVDALAEQFGLAQEYLALLLDRDEADRMTVNIWRLTQAQIVSEILKQRGTYTLELEGIRDGTDATEYFLSNGMRGYCSHFASAGTLILRGLGVPARYASGYVIQKKEFHKNEDGTYTAHVLDTASHNWTEIYLAGIGWVPIEMTPGYANVPYGTTDETQNENSQNKTPGTPYIPDHPKGQTTDPDTPQQQPDETVTTTHRSKNERIFAGIVAVFVLLIVAAAAVACYLYVQGFLRERGRKQMKLLIAQRKNRRAVRRMNRQIYKRLTRKKMLLKKDISDRQYQHLLQQTYVQLSTDEVERFMEIVKKAAFSLEEISDEEVTAVYDIFESTQNRQKN